MFVVGPFTSSVYTLVRDEDTVEGFAEEEQEGLAEDAEQGLSMIFSIKKTSWSQKLKERRIGKKIIDG